MAKRRPTRRGFVGRGKDAAKAIAFIRAAREEMDVSQAELARRMGVSQSKISKFERFGHVKLAKVAAYFKALGVTLEIRIDFPEGAAR